MENLKEMAMPCGCVVLHVHGHIKDIKSWCTPCRDRWERASADDVAALDQVIEDAVFNGEVKFVKPR